MASDDSGSLRRYAVTRLALVIPMLFILLTMVFVLMRIAPGDPVTAALGGHLPPEELAARRHAAGYDRPIWAQYGSYLKQLLTGHLGHPIVGDRGVGQIIKDNGGATLELTVFATLPVTVRLMRRMWPPRVKNIAPPDAARFWARSVLTNSASPLST